ncbi:Rid family hydrolase [Geomicrobium sediminis]|uniref:Enamine deaminase RidA (YjgF/YER057c/UK114 family) n=1 Tax=Geomicrobium sediminis TaxID=1347788 RepID=A0ABS2PCG7_9BACL|nr:enamine deaminase RidA (YjgF/YER057c/UK114 family) [Geomicrobium sediminis]
MEKRNPELVHQPVAPYVHQIEVNEPGRRLILSGQLGMQQNGEVPEQPMEQLKLALQNIDYNLQEANMNRSHLTKLTFYLVGEFPLSERRDVIQGYVGDGLPCTTLLYVAALAAPQFKVEIDAEAFAPNE